MKKISADKLLTLKATITKDNLENYYKLHNKIDTKDFYKISLNELDNLLTSYNIKKTKIDIRKTKELTYLNRYGVTNPFIDKQKIKDAVKAKYGVEHYSKTPEGRSKAKILGSDKKRAIKCSETKLKKFQALLATIPKPDIYQKYIIEDLDYYNVAKYYKITPWTLDKILKEYDLHKPRNQSAKKGLITKYSISGSKELYFKSLNAKKNQTIIKNTGSLEAHYNNVMQKTQATCLKRYGVAIPLQNINIRKKQAQSARQSTLEKRIKEFLINNKIQFLQHYIIKEDTRIHEFDFAIFKDNVLDLLIDCDGTYYHGYLSDQNGKSVYSYSDDYRQSLVPENVKFYILTDADTETTIHKDILKLININYDEYVLDIFNWCRSFEFPYPNISDKDIVNSYKALIKNKIDKFSMKARYGERIILAKHKSLWKCNKKNQLSPYNAWQDDELLLKCIKNRLIYKGNNLDPSKVLAGLSITKIASKVSVFNPYLAKYLISKYLNEFDIIFDPCSGYSGRLLGCCSLNKRYIGQDINNVIIKESEEIIDTLKLDANIATKDSLITSGKYDCLFTCPPYNDKENWNQEIRNLTCDDWITKCLENYDCKKYLFVVDTTNNYKEFIVEELINTSHFSKNKEYVILIQK